MYFKQKNDYVVCWLSSGVSSFIAGYFLKDIIDSYIYIDIPDQHPDSLRFINDCSKCLNREVLIIRPDEGSVEDVARKYKYLNSPFGAACTGMLKKNVRKRWENSKLIDFPNIHFVYVWGYDFSEIKRSERLISSNPEYTHLFPLIDNYFSKQDCHALCNKLGVKRPIMYDLGFSNNNCVGCVKGGKYYWNQIRKYFPDVFEKRAKLERDLGCSCLNGVYLDELPLDAGRPIDEISEDCGVMCFLSLTNNP